MSYIQIPDTPPHKTTAATYHFTAKAYVNLVGSNTYHGTRAVPLPIIIIVLDWLVSSMPSSPCSPLTARS